MQQGLGAAAVANGESSELPDELLSSLEQLEIERWQHPDGRQSRRHSNMTKQWLHEVHR